MTAHVLILCRHNSARSVLAELAQHDATRLQRAIGVLEKVADAEDAEGLLL